MDRCPHCHKPLNLARRYPKPDIDAMERSAMKNAEGTDYGRGRCAITLNDPHRCKLEVIYTEGAVECFAYFHIMHAFGRMQVARETAIIVLERDG